MLTGKRKRFVDEYLIDLNAAKACRRAGFASADSANQAYKLMRDPEIIEAVQVANEQRAARVRASGDRVIAELVGMAHSNVLQGLNVDEATGDIEVDIRNMTPDQAAAVASIETETRTEMVNGKPVVTKTVKLKYHPKSGPLVRLADLLNIGGKGGVEPEDIADDPDPPVAPEAS